MSQLLFFKIYQNGKVLRITQAKGQQVSLGNDSQADVVLSEDGVLPWHALIEKRETEYVLSDLGSQTGTLLNNQPIVEAPVHHGDQITIGSFTIEFFVGTPFNKASDLNKETESRKIPKKNVKTQQKPHQEESIETTQSVEENLLLTEKKTPSLKKTPIKRIKKAIKPIEEKKRVSKPKVRGETTLPLEDSSEQVSSFVSQSHDLNSETKQSFGKSLWHQLIPVKNSKKTFAPPDAIKDLDEMIAPGSGQVVEVLVAWKNRVISVYHSRKNETITIGGSKDATIQVPNLMQSKPYPLVYFNQIAQINLSSNMDGKIITSKRSVDFNFAIKKGVITTRSSGMRVLSLGQNEVVRVDFHPSLQVYVRYTGISNKAQKAKIFDFNETELMGLGIAVCLMVVLFFYIGVYYPRTLEDEEKIQDKLAQVATIQFKPPKKKRIVRIKVKKTKIKKRRNIPVAKKTKTPPKRNRNVIKKRGKLGTVGQVASKKKAKKRWAKKATSARSGGSRIQTKKPGSGAKSPKVDPTQIGLLGAFGRGGLKKQLDKAYTGAGELGGLADKATGRSGTRETYVGEGIGTKFKSAGAGGKGSNMIGISNINTKGKGGGTKGFGRGGGLGVRGQVNLSFGLSKMDVEGSVDRNAIKRVIAQNRSKLEGCYSRALQNNPSIQGRIRLRWTIEGIHVRNVRTESNSSGSATLANCIRNHLKNFKFPGAVPKDGIAAVSFPFVFTGG